MNSPQTDSIQYQVSNPLWSMNQPDLDQVSNLLQSIIQPEIFSDILIQLTRPTIRQ